MKKALIGAAVGIVAVYAIVIIMWFVVGTTLPNLRDLLLIAISIFLLLFVLGLVAVAFALFGLFSYIRSRVPEVFDKASSGMESVRGTTGFVSERVASPLIKVSAAAAGARAAVQTLVRRNDGK